MEYAEVCAERRARARLRTALGRELAAQQSREAHIGMIVHMEGEGAELDAAMDHFVRAIALQEATPALAFQT